MFNLNGCAYRYGKDAGEASKDIGHAAADSMLVTVSMRRMGMRAVAKRIAKHTATGFIRTAQEGPSGERLRYVNKEGCRTSCRCSCGSVNSLATCYSIVGYLAWRRGVWGGFLS